MIPPRTPVIVVGLGFGDEGKGAVVDGLTRRRDAQLVVRFNGGPQAAHHVVLPNGKWHCFAQFGSGTLAGAKTYLSRHMLVNPLNLEREADKLGELISDPWSRIVIDERCVVVTQFHRTCNRLLEAKQGHGSCGQGVAQAWLDGQHGRPQLLWGDLRDEGKTCRILEKIRDAKMVQYPEFMGALADISIPTLAMMFADVADRVRTDRGETLSCELAKDPSKVIFEGAQGALLDARFGFFPYVTPSHTSCGNAVALLREHNITDCFKLGVLRSYSTRHGAGPMVAEDPTMGSFGENDAHNKVGTWQKHMRAGPFDVVAARYGMDISQPDGLFVTHMDRVLQSGFPDRICIGWEISSDCERPRGDYIDGSNVLTYHDLLGRESKDRTTDTTAFMKAKPQWSQVERTSFLEEVFGKHFPDLPLAGFSAGPSADKQTWAPSPSLVSGPGLHANAT